MGTRLLRDKDDPLRFVTIDDWESEELYRAFRVRFAVEYAALDRICEGCTSAESPLGQFVE
jgi:quinol monooxygenase YgiN